MFVWPTSWLSCKATSVTLDITCKLCNWGPVSWRLTTIKWRQSSQSNRYFTIATRQTNYHEALPLSVNVQSHLTSLFADDGNASWYSVCQVSMVEWRLDCENCCHLTVFGLHDTGPEFFIPAMVLTPLISVILSLTQWPWPWLRFTRSMER